ncbi:MAG: hypothetical protein QW343_03635 [Candidatus Norongarragalinales archaeon]
MGSKEKEGWLNVVWATLQQRLADAFARVGENFVAGLGDVVVVLIFLAVGWIVAKFLCFFLNKFLLHVGLEKWIKKKGLETALLGFTVTGVLDSFLKLVTIAVFLGIAADITRLLFLRDLVTWFIGYVPLLVQGATIIVLALLAGDYVTDRIKESKIPFGRFLGVVFEIFVIYTALVMALPLILPNADVEILKTAFILIVGGVVFALALGFAIAIGLGAKDSVARLAKKKENDLEKLV